MLLGKSNKVGPLEQPAVKGGKMIGKACAMKGKCWSTATSVTRLGDFLDFGQLF